MTKTPFVPHEKLLEIAEKFPTPFYLYDERGIKENAKRFIEAFSWNAGFREYFAVKATPNPAIMKILRELGCGFDCSSYTELLLANEFCGAAGDDIMFSSNATPDKDFLLARKIGAVINLDDFTHIEILNKLCGIPETISARYNPGGEFRLGAEISGGRQVMDVPGDAKYGFTFQQLLDGYPLLKKLGAKTFGLHSFLASNTLSNEYYPALAEIMFRAAVEIKEKTGIELGFINLSGGVGIPYRPDQEPNDIAAISAGVRAAYEKILVPAGLSDVKIFTELGRYVLAPYGVLVTKAIREKHIYKEYIGCDACAVNLMRPAMYGAYHHITVSGKENAVPTETYDITGGLCENNDKFAVDRLLPKIGMGDLLIIHDAGAHGHSMGYNYNGKLRSAELLLQEDGEVRQIRRAETEEDYFATLR